MLPQIIEEDFQEIQIGNDSGKELDIYNGTLDSELVFPVGQKVHLVTEVLSRDLYKPLNIGALFSHLYPNEYFNIYSSPVRVHQILHRAKSFYKQHDIPLHIESVKGGYQLVVSSGGQLRIPLIRPKIESESGWIYLAKKSLGQQSHFTMKQLQDVLSFKQGRARNLVKKAIESGQLVQVGRGSSTSYRFLS